MRSRRLLASLLVALLFAVSAAATVLTVSNVGAAAAGEAAVPDPGSVTAVSYSFSGGAITQVKVRVQWAGGIAPGDYVVRVELLNPAGSVLRSGEFTVINPAGGSTADYTINITPSMGFSDIQAYANFRAYIVRTAPP
jgi:hypothetical protein